MHNEPNERSDFAQPPKRAWWINQGQTYDDDKRSGVIFSEIRKSDSYSHADIFNMSVGDHTVHYLHKQVLAFGEVTSVASRTVYARNNQSPEVEGYLLHIDYRELIEPIYLSDISLQVRQDEAIRRIKGSVFNKKGGVNFGYIFELSEELLLELQKCSIKKDPRNSL